MQVEGLRQNQVVRGIAPHFPQLHQAAIRLLNANLIHLQHLAGFGQKVAIFTHPGTGHHECAFHVHDLGGRRRSAGAEVRESVGGVPAIRAFLWGQRCTQLCVS